MIDPILKIALTVKNNPGKFALLLGSGVSQSAGVPTGIEVVHSIIREMARALKEVPENPYEWYREHYGEDPEYSKLLARISQTRTERKGVLQKYFEASPEEKKKGIKVPTVAHHSIASLIVKGYFRMVITTNFDRLLEQALELKGIIPDVVTGEDEIRSGTLNYVHSNCTLWKINGDYKDTRIRNLTGELEEYPPIYDKYFERVFEDFGLIICGWSANYDIALRQALVKFSKRRYGIYFCQLVSADTNKNASSLVKTLGGEFLPIKSGDAFFTELRDKINALEEGEAREPFSENVAVRLVEEYVTVPAQRSRLTLLFQEEMQALYTVLCSLEPSDPIETNIRKIETAGRKLSKMMGALMFSETDQDNQVLIRRVFRTFMGSEEIAKKNEDKRFGILLEYPIVLFLHTVGLFAVERGYYDFLFRMMSLSQIDDDGAECPLIYYYHPARRLKPLIATAASGYHSLRGKERLFVWEYHLRDLLWDFFQEHFVNRTYYDQVFNLFEFYENLAIAVSLKERGMSHFPVALSGIYAIESKRMPRGYVLIQDFITQLKAELNGKEEKKTISFPGTKCFSLAFLETFLKKAEEIQEDDSGS
jgi:hypothetical protein